jgi:glyoxylase-like metal-dependent hydrolase (beta-lactamase superfamily II)
MDEIAAGLRRWTSFHPDWEEEVGSLALETDDGPALFDPLEPPRELKRPEHVFITVFWHYRSTPSLKAKHVWASRRTVKALANRGVTVTDPIARDATLPTGVEALETGRHGELVYWLPAQKAVVVGDVLLGAGAKPRATKEPLRLCPEHWLGKARSDDVRASLRPLLDLPVQRVLVSHGAPVLRGGKRALERVLQAPSAA